MVCLFLLHRKLRLCFSFSPSGLEPSIESRTIFVLDPWQVASVTQFVVSVTGMIDDSCWEILEKAMATHSSTLAWKIPWKEEPGRLLSMGSHRVRHDWSNVAAAAAAGKSYWGLLTIRRVMKHWVPEGFWAGSSWAGPHIGGGGWGQSCDHAWESNALGYWGQFKSVWSYSWTFLCSLRPV